MIMALTIAVLAGGGVYMVLQRGMVRIVFGMSLISHAANLIILASGIGAWRGEPFGDGRTDLADAADPLPQAFVLTAIVISMATTAFMLALAALGRNDDTRVEDAVEEDPQHILSLKAEHGADGRTPAAVAAGDKPKKKAKKSKGAKVKGAKAGGVKAGGVKVKGGDAPESGQKVKDNHE